MTQWGQHVAEYNVYAMIYKLERSKEYHLNWEGIDKGNIEKTDKEKKKMETIEEEGEDGQTEETKDTEAKDKQSETMEEGKEETIEEKNVETMEEKEVPEGAFDKNKSEGGTQETKPSQAEGEEATFITEKKEENISQKFCTGILDGLREIKVRIKPLSDGIDKLSGKKKYQGLFDVISNGFLQAVTLKDDCLTKLLVPETGIVYQENA